MSKETRGRAIGPGTELDGFVTEAVAGREVLYRARQRCPDRAVARRVIASSLAEDPQFRHRLQAGVEHRRADRAPKCDPGARGGRGGVLYIAMRFVDDTDLRALLAQEGRLEPHGAATIVGHVAQARVQVPHRRGSLDKVTAPLAAGEGLIGDSRRSRSGTLAPRDHRRGR